MLSSVEQAFVGREEIRAPLKTHAWEARFPSVYCRIENELDRSNRHAILLQTWQNIIQSSVETNVVQTATHLESEAFLARHELPKNIECKTILESSVL